MSKQYNNKMPALAIRFRDTNGTKHTDLMIISALDLSALLEEVEYYREQSITRA